MKLEFKKDLFSIIYFDSVEIPKFTILTGLNGSGKSQLLQALRYEHVTLENINKNQVVFFDNALFALDNEPMFNYRLLQDDRKNIYAGVIEHLKRQDLLKSIKDFIPQIIELASINNIGFYSLTSDVLKERGLENIERAYNNYVKGVSHVVNQVEVGANSNISKTVLRRILSKIKKPLEYLTREEFDLSYSPVSYKNNFLINNLAKVFSDYWDKWELNSYNQYRNNHYNEEHKIYNEQEFIEEFGEKPWDIINNIILRFGSLEYKFNNPEGFERGHDYQIRLVSSKDSNIVIDFDRLSSGERIMMALVSTLYKTKIDNQFPKLLLLDEIDSSLHPSMLNSMLEVIQEELVNKKGVNVILVTHSPSTVAMAPEDSVFVMKKNGTDRILKSTSEEALHILSEGFASLTLSESNLKVSYNIERSSNFVLLTEGITDKIILEAAWKQLENNELNFDIQDCFDASFLRNLFARGEIFKNYPNKIFIALFDFDTEGYSAWNNLSNFNIIQDDPKKGLLKKHGTLNAFALLLPVPNGDVENQVVQSGLKTFEEKSHLPIELMFSTVPAFKNSFVNEPQVGGGNIIKFKGDKTTFAQKVSAKLVSTDFYSFMPLFDTIKNIFK